MSDTADDMEYYLSLLEGSLEDIHEAYEMGYLEWTTSKGQNINIRDMTDTHLGNTLKFLGPKPDNHINRAWIEIIRREFVKRNRERQ